MTNFPRDTSRHPFRGISLSPPPPKRTKRARLHARLVHIIHSRRRPLTRQSSDLLVPPSFLERVGQAHFRGVIERRLDLRVAKLHLRGVEQFVAQRQLPVFVEFIADTRHQLPRKHRLGIFGLVKLAIQKAR